MTRPRLRTPAFVVTLVLLVGGGGAAGYFETHALRHHHNPPAGARSTGPSSVPTALALATAAPTTPTAGTPAASTPTASDSPTAPEPVPSLVGRALRGPLGSAAFGPQLLGRVLDVTTGAVLLDDDGDTPAAPASTAKLMTAAAALTVHPPTYRFTTTVVAGAQPGTVVLVGGGDPTLTAAPAGKPGAYPGAARVSDLAAQLRARHVTVSRIVVDDALFSGPSVSPDWAAEDVPSDYAAAITAAMVDGGRATPGAAVRSATPDLAAGHALAAALGSPDLPVSRGIAPTSAERLASVRSAPLSQLVEQMLQQSDNVIAEVLARQVALARKQPASFTGAATAVRGVLAGLGVQAGGGMRDGSGLAAADRVAPAALAALLRVIAGDTHPQLHDVLAGLPVGGWSGTLADRYLAGSGSASAAGLVRAKTGTLTGVSSLAGVVHDRSGRLLAFAFIADHAPSNTAADAALDRVVAALATCGCS